VRSEQESMKSLTDLERFSKRMIEANIKERIENEKKIGYALNQQIDLISSEVTKETTVKNSKFNIFL
jgi:hypothetical protein